MASPICTLLIHPDRLHAESLGDANRIDAIQPYARVLPGLMHHATGLTEGAGYDAIPAVVGDQVEDGDPVVRRRPQPRVGVVHRAVPNQPYHRLARRRQFGADRRADAVTLRPAGGANIDVGAPARLLLDAVQRSGELLGGYKSPSPLLQCQSSASSIASGRTKVG